MAHDHTIEARRRAALRPGTVAAQWFLAGALGGVILWFTPRAFADEVANGMAQALRLRAPQTFTTRTDPHDFLNGLNLVLPKTRIPLTLQDAVAGELLLRTKTMSQTDALRAARALCDEARRLGYDPLLFLAVIYVESYFDHTAVSVVGAEGLMQLMPPTAAWMAARENVEWAEGRAFDPELNVVLGSRYLAYLDRTYKGRMDLALTAYNRGPHNTDSILRTYGQLPKHVHDFYAGKVLERYELFKVAYGHLPVI